MSDRSNADEERPFGVCRSRVMKPNRARLREALAAVEGITHGPEAWEALETRGLLPMGTVGEGGRVFGGWVLNASDPAKRHPVERAPMRGTVGATMRLDDASPQTVGLAVALASDWPGVATAERYARAAWEYLRPWIANRGVDFPPVCWRLGDGDAKGERGELWFPRGYAAIAMEQPIEDSGELRSELRRRPARSLGEVTALEDGWCSSVLSELRERAMALRDARDEQRLADKSEPLGRSVRAPGEGNAVFWWAGELGTGVAVTREMARRYMLRFAPGGGFGAGGLEALPDWPTLRDPFEPLVALWNLGYAAVQLTPRALLLEVSAPA